MASCRFVPAFVVGILALSAAPSQAPACETRTARCIAVASQQMDADASRPQPAPAARAADAAPIDPQSIDPVAFFNALVERYHRLTGYRDSARLIQITSRDGQEPQTVETTVWCTIDGDELVIRTPASQVADAMNLGAIIGSADPVRKLQRDYGLWLAPHMVLHAAERPLKQLREGVKEEFTPSQATAVEVDSKPLVHVELRTCPSEGSGDCATVGLYVDPESMLVKRVESRQRLPDGAQYEATLEITTTLDETAAPRAQPAPEGGAAPAAAPETPARPNRAPVSTPARTAAKRANEGPASRPDDCQPAPPRTGVRTATTPRGD